MRTLYAAVILAGGYGRRLGGQDKPSITLGGLTLLDRVLAACHEAKPLVVVGPEVRGGPVAAIAAGLRRVPDTDRVAILAADQPFLTSRALDELAAALPGHDGAVYTDDAGRRQWLCGMWHAGPLRSRIAGIEPAGAAFRTLTAGLDIAELKSDAAPPPWFDCDTPEQLRTAERWLSTTRRDR